MNKPLTFREVKNSFNYTDNDKIIIWELFYQPHKTFFGKISYNNKKAKDSEFPIGLVITILNRDNIYHQISTTGFNLRTEEIQRMVLEPMFIVGHLNMTWLNFLIFKRSPMSIIKGWFYDIDDQVDITVTHAYKRQKNQNWKDCYNSYQTKSTLVSIDTPIITNLAQYEAIASIHSMYNMPDVAMVIRNIESLC